MEKWRVRGMCMDRERRLERLSRAVAGRDRGSLIASIITEDAARGAPRESDATEHEGLTKLKPNAGGREVTK